MTDASPPSQSTGLGRLFYMHVAVEVVVIGAVVALFMRRNSELEQRIRTLEETVATLASQMQEMAVVVKMQNLNMHGPQTQGAFGAQEPQGPRSFAQEPRQDYAPAGQRRRRGAIVEAQPMPDIRASPRGNILTEMLMMPPLSMMASMMAHPMDGVYGNNGCTGEACALGGALAGECDSRIQEVPDESLAKKAVPADDPFEDSDSEIAEELEELKQSEIKTTCT